jgi:hypothetical protein
MAKYIKPWRFYGGICRFRETVTYQVFSPYSTNIETMTLGEKHGH